MKLYWIRTASVCLAIVACMVWASPIMAQGNGKGNGNGGGGGDPPPSSAPVEYQLTLFGEAEQQIDVRNMNIHGAVVGGAVDSSGSKFAFVWSSDTGIVNLNDIATVPAGWELYGARGINDSGQIAGQALNLATSQLVAFRYDPTTSDVEIMQTFSGDDHLAGWYDPINEAGDVLYYSTIQDADGTFVGFRVFVDTISGDLYDVMMYANGRPTSMNDNRQVVGGLYRLSLGASANDPYVIESFEDTGITGMFSINNSGYFPSATNRRFRGQNVKSAVRYTNTLETLQQDDSVGFAINASTATSNGDVVGQIPSTNSGFVYMDEYGFFDFDDLVIGDTADLQEWFSANYLYSRHITDRGANGFGTICGEISTADGSRGFVLTPIPLP